MNKLNTAKRIAVAAALVEGNSIRSVCRMTGVSKPTVLRLLNDLGRVCEDYHHQFVRDVQAVRVQCDEIWSFCYAKQKNVTVDVRARVAGAGDVWVGYQPYLSAVKFAFEDRTVDYATLQKIYGNAENEGRYSPGKIISSSMEVIKGNPDRAHISTSYVERQNLTMRMSIRRYMRLTNAFSKKLQNHVAAVHLHFLHYNFCRIHQTLRVTPAMAAGLSQHVWNVSDIVALLDATENKAA